MVDKPLVAFALILKLMLFCVARAVLYFHECTIEEKFIATIWWRNTGFDQAACAGDGKLYSSHDINVKKGNSFIEMHTLHALKNLKVYKILQCF